MGNASLAGVPAILGLYTCVFPNFLYPFLAPSPHLTLGTSALISMVIVGPVNRLSDGSSTPQSDDGDGGEGGAGVVGTQDGDYTPEEVAVAITFLVGVIQCALFVGQVKRIMWLMSEVWGKIGGRKYAWACKENLFLCLDRDERLRDRGCGPSYRGPGQDHSRRGGPKSQRSVQAHLCETNRLPFL